MTKPKSAKARRKLSLARKKKSHRIPWTHAFLIHVAATLICVFIYYLRMGHITMPVEDSAVMTATCIIFGSWFVLSLFFVQVPKQPVEYELIPGNQNTIVRVPPLIHMVLMHVGLFIIDFIMADYLVNALR